MKKTGFTLAEMLLTVGIIGVIAALTAPAVIMKSINEQNASKLSSIVSTLEKCFTTAIVKDGAEDLYGTGMWSKVPNNGLFASSTETQIKNFLDEFGNYVAISGYEKETGQNFYTGVSTYEMNTKGGKGNAVDVIDNNMFPIFLSNGAVVFFEGHGQGTNNTQKSEDNIRAAGGSVYAIPAEVYIDVNGASAPNTIGRDIFYLYVGQDGFLYPEGSREIAIFKCGDVDSCKDNSKLATWNNAKGGSSCVSGSINNSGLGCTARLIEENYKMNY